MEQPPEMDGCAHGLSAQRQVELPRLLTQGLEGRFDLVGVQAAAHGERLQLMFDLANDLAAVIAAHVACDLPAPAVKSEV